MTIGQKIKAQREARHLTQEELGKACGTTKQTIFKYEMGLITNIPMDRLCKIAEVLDVTPSYLMGWDEPASTSSTPGINLASASRLSAPEEQLISSFRQLNGEGQSKVIDYAADLAASGRYIKDLSAEAAGA